MAKDQGNLAIGVAALAALGIGGYLAYQYLLKPTCKDGAMQCLNNVSQICQNGGWQDGGNACGSGGACAPEGAEICIGGVGQKCVGGSWESSPVCGGAHDCSTSNACGQQQTTCVNGTLLSDPLLEYDPAQGRCICYYQTATPDAAVCLKHINYFVPRINNQTNMPYMIGSAGSCLIPGLPAWQLAKAPRILFSVDVRDQWGHPYANLPITIYANSPPIGGFLQPGESVLRCSGGFMTTDASGHAEIDWLWTWNAGGIGLQIVNQNFTMIAYGEDGSEAVVYPSLQIECDAMIATWTCQAYDDSNKRCKPA